MVCNEVTLRHRRDTAKFSGLGIVIFSLSSLVSALAQQPASAPAVQPVGAAKETSAPATPANPTERVSSEYTVSPEDLLDIDVMDVPEVTHTYRVSSNGFLTLPLLPEPIPVAGETLDQLSHLIAASFHDAGMLNNAQVTISLKETRLHTVLVSGKSNVPRCTPFMVYLFTRYSHSGRRACR